MAPKAQPTGLPSALLLAATGGLTDAVVYLLHGHVFANAMTGNVVFLGISLVTRDWKEILPHVAPILAYLAGVSAAQFFQAVPLRRSSLIALGLEILALFGVGLIPADAPHAAFTLTVAFVSAFQVSTFRRVGRFNYNSTFITGNLRDFTASATGLLLERERDARAKGRQKAIDLGLICLCFLAGATLGAGIAPHFHTHALWFAEPLLLITLLLTLRHPASDLTEEPRPQSQASSGA